MKTLYLTILAILISPIATAQTPATLPQNVYAVGAAANNGASPQAAVMALAAHRLGSAGTFGFTEFDVLPQSVKPFTVQTDVAVGVAQKAFSIWKVDIYAAADAGFAWKGSNLGWQWKPGFLASIKLYENVRLYPNVRFRGSNLDGGSGVQPIFGLMIGYAK